MNWKKEFINRYAEAVAHLAARSWSKPLREAIYEAVAYALRSDAPYEAFLAVSYAVEALANAFRALRAEGWAGEIERALLELDRQVEEASFPVVGEEASSFVLAKSK
jgi:hypothetical protein